MKITHPVKGFNGFAQVGAFGLHFLAGETHVKADDIPRKSRDAMEAEGFTFTDDRPGRGTQDDSAEGDEPDTTED